MIGGELLICGVKLVNEISVSLKECIFNKIFIDNNPHIIDFNDFNFNDFNPSKSEFFFKNENRGLTVKSKNVNYEGDLPEGWKKFNGYLLGPNSQPIDLKSNIETEEVIEENPYYKQIGSSHIIGPYININGLNEGIENCNLFRIKSSGIEDITLPNHYKVLNGKIYGPYVEIDTLNDDITGNSIKFDHIKITSETANNYIFGSIEELFLDVSGVPKNFKKVKFDNEDMFLFGEYRGRFEKYDILWGEGMKHTEDTVKKFDLTIDNLKLDNAQLKNCIVKNKNKLLYLKDNFIFDGSKIDGQVNLEKLEKEDDNGEAKHKNFKLINISKTHNETSKYKRFEYRNLPFVDIINSNMNGINLGFRVKKNSELNTKLEVINDRYKIHGLLIESVRYGDNTNEIRIRIRLYRGNRFKYEDRVFKALERQSKERAGSEKDITTNKLHIITNETTEKRIIINELFGISEGAEDEYLKFIHFEPFNGIVITISNEYRNFIEKIFEKIIDFDETIKFYYTEKSRSIPREYISRYNLFNLKSKGITHFIGPNMDYSGMDLSGLKFPEGIDLSGCNFNNAKLYDVDFNNLDISNATFENVEYITIPVGLPNDIEILDDIDDEYIYTILTGSIESLAGKRGIYDWKEKEISFINKNINLDLLLELCTNHKYRLLLPINIEDYFNNYNVESNNGNFNMETFLEANYQKYLKEDAEMEKEILDIRNLRRDDYEEAHQIFLDTRNNKIGKAIGKHKIKQLKRNKEPNNYRLKKYMEKNNWEEINKQKYRNTETGQVLAKPKLLNLALTLESDYTSYSVKDLISLLKGCSIKNKEGEYYLGIGSIVQDGEFNKDNFPENDFRFSQFINCKFTGITFTGDFRCASFVGCIFNNCKFAKDSVTKTKGLKITFAQIEGKDELNINDAILIEDCYFNLKHLVGKDIDTSSDVELDVSFYKSKQDPNEIWKFTSENYLIERGNIQKFSEVNIVNLEEIEVKHTFHKKADKTFNLYDQNKVNNSHLSEKGLAQLGKNSPNGIFVKNRFSRCIEKTKHNEKYKTIQQRVSLIFKSGGELNLENCNLEGVSLHGEKDTILTLNNTNCVDTDFNKLTINEATNGIFSNTKFNNCKRGGGVFSKTYDENGKQYAYYALEDSSDKLLVVGKGINLEGRDISALNSKVSSEEESKPIVDLSTDKLYGVSTKGELTYEKIKLPIEYCILEGWLLGEGVNAVGIFSQFTEQKGYVESNWSELKDDNNPDWYEKRDGSIWNSRDNKIYMLDKNKNLDVLDDNLDNIKNLRFLNFSFANFKYGNLSRFPEELFNSIPYYGADLSYTYFGIKFIPFNKLRSLKSRAVGKQIIFQNSNLSKADLSGVRNANVIKLFKLNDIESKPKISGRFQVSEIQTKTSKRYEIKRITY